MNFRHQLLPIVAILFAALPSAARANEGAPTGGVSIIRVFSGWREAGSFKRILEYFDGKEHTHGEAMLRTQAGQRAGYYFLVRAANPGAPMTVKVNLQLIMPANAKPREFNFTTGLPSGASVLNLGITGGDWPDARTNPVAWKLELVSTEGRVLATEKSYLWEKPAAP